MSIFRSATSFIILVLFINTQIDAQQSTFTLEDYNKIINISSLDISPDGTKILFQTRERNMEKNQFISSLIVLDVATKKHSMVSESLAGISSPKWTNDSRRISLIMQDNGIRQVHILDPQTKELTQHTQSDGSVIRYSWSPDGSRLAYMAKTKNENQSKSFNDSFEVGSNDYLVDKAPTNTSVWIVNKDGSNVKRITPEDFTVATGLTTSALSWSGNGKLLAFTKYPSSFSGDSDLGTNFIYEIESGNLKAATTNSQRESNPRFGPSNEVLYYQYPKNGHPSNRRDWYRVALNTMKISNVTDRYDPSISDIKWVGNDEIVARGIGKWGNRLYKIGKSGISTAPSKNLSSITSWSVADNGQIALIGITEESPAEIYFKSSWEADPVRLTDFNSFVSDLELGKQEGVSWTSSDGLSPNGVLTYPPDFDPTKKYPLVLHIHGGPSAASLLGFNPIVQTMAAKGWIIFQPNYRGSTNLGNAFQAAIARDPSEGPGQDVVAGINDLKARPYIDQNKIAVSGWSYGGWMTSWLIGRYPDMWKCAVAGAAPVDVTDMYSLNDLNRMKRHSMVESPYVGENMDWAFKNSPISNFNKIKAPTLIMSKTADTRVTITGSYKLYGALRDNNIPVQFIAYPGPGHFPRDPVRTHDVYTRWINWLDQYLTDEPE